MGVVYYQYKSEKDIYSMQVPHAFISVSELKQLIKTSDKHGRGRTRGRPTEDIIISNAQTGEEYTDERALVLQNTTVLVRRICIPGQLSEKIILSPVREVTEGCSAPSSKSVVTDSNSKSCSSVGVQDEDAAIAAVINAAELKLEQHLSKRGQGSGRCNYGHGPLEGETPPPGYVCRSCSVPGHFIQHCPRESKTPPPGYICYRCRIPGHFIHHCMTIGDPKFHNNKMSRSLAPVVTVSPVNGILEELVPAAPVSAVDDLPAELHCRLCKKSDDRCSVDKQVLF
jgi:E3 ubiquitin-protein ligase RBBP6